VVAGPIAAIANNFQFSLFFGGEDEDAGPLSWIGLIGIIIFAPLAASLLQLGVSRQREYLADASGAELLGRGSSLADALETLERRAQTVPLDVNPATASLYIVNPLRSRPSQRSSPPTLRSPSGSEGSGRSTAIRRFAWSRSDGVRGICQWAQCSAETDSVRVGMPQPYNQARCHRC